MDNKLTQTNFINAAKLIHSNGLIKGKYSKGVLHKGPKHCALGALGAQIGYPTGPGPHRFPRAVAEPTFSGIRVDIMNFNDNPDTTKEDVETLLLLMGEMAAEEQET
jgi:hypothetical protein